jgi:hypothetical protein
MAAAQLPEATRLELADRVARFEADLGAGEHERLRRLAASLIAAHATPPSHASGPS